MKRAALYALCLPMDAIALLVALVWRYAWGLHWYTAHGALWVKLSRKSWPARTWYRRWAGTTLGHTIILGAGDTTERTERHELVHVEQFEVEAAQSAVLGAAAALSGSPWLGLGLWALGPFVGLTIGMLVAWLRGEDAYRGSVHEESAYSQTDHDATLKA